MKIIYGKEEKIEKIPETLIESPGNKYYKLNFTLPKISLPAAG